MAVSSQRGDQPASLVPWNAATERANQPIHHTLPAYTVSGLSPFGALFETKASFDHYWSRPFA